MSVDDTDSSMVPPQLPALPTANPTVDAEIETAPVYPPVLINIIKSLERLLPQVLQDGLMWIDQSNNLWRQDFWTDTLLTPQGNASYKAKGSNGLRELRPHVLPILQKGFDREGIHTIDAMFWFDKIFIMLKRRGSITDDEKLILRDLAELHGEKIVAYKPQVFGREEMRQHTNCNVQPNTSANSAVQIPCPIGHHCRCVTEVPGGASQHVKKPLLVFGKKERFFLFAHQYTCSECVRG